MKNKFYQVYDKYDIDGLCNIVIASTSREAKKIGSNCEATVGAYSWIDLEVKAIKCGMLFWTEDNGSRVEVMVGGHGYLYTDKKPQLDSLWVNFIEELKNQNRYLEEKRDD